MRGATRFRKAGGAATVFAVRIGLLLLAAGVAYLSISYAPESNSRMTEFKGQTTGVFDLVLLPDEERLAYRTITGTVRSISLSDTSGGYDVEDLSHDKVCFDMTSSANGECLMLACLDEFRVHFPRRPHDDFSIEVPQFYDGYLLGISPDGLVGAVEYSGSKIVLRSLKSGIQLGIVNISQERHRKPFAVHSQGVLYIGIGNRIELWRFSPDGRSSPQFSGNLLSDGHVSQLLISNGGELLVAWGNCGELTVWDLAEQKVLWQRTDATYPFPSVISSCNDKYFALVESPRTVTLLEFKTGKLAGQLTVDADFPASFHNNVTGCVLSRQSDVLYVADSEGVIRVLSVPDLVEERRFLSAHGEIRAIPRPAKRGDGKKSQKRSVVRMPASVLWGM